MNCIALTIDGLEQSADLYGRLMVGAAGLANDVLFARMIASQAADQGVLPVGLGLAQADYGELLRRHFPALLPGEMADACPPGDDRLDERRDLVDLLLEYRDADEPSSAWMAAIVAAACMGGDHLWQDLGLWSRTDLSRLMNDNFPALAALNDRDMKWKKFLYRRICEREGVYVCPAPSCQACADYAKCFNTGC
jgi:nitrogen fixation protein NifQ